MHSIPNPYTLQCSCKVEYRIHWCWTHTLNAMNHIVYYVYYYICNIAHNIQHQLRKTSQNMHWEVKLTTELCYRLISQQSVGNFCSNTVVINIFSYKAPIMDRPKIKHCKQCWSYADSWVWRKGIIPSLVAMYVFQDQSVVIHVVNILISSLPTVT